MSRLVAPTLDGKVVPDLAESWDVSTDAKTYTFKLRQDAVWHDGKPVTAADVAFTYNAALRSDTGSTLASQITVAGAADVSGGKAKTASGIQIVDDHTVRFVLEHANAALLIRAFAFLYIAPEHAFDGMAPAEYVKSPFSTQTLIGSGPFRMTEYKPDEFVTFEAFDGYFRGRPIMDKVVLKSYADLNVLEIDLEKGNIDWTIVQAPAPDLLSKLRSITNVSVSTAAVGFNVFVAPSYSRPFLRDKRVRQALLYALDRGSLAAKVLGGTVKPAVISDWIAPWATAPDLNSYPYDPAKAKALLAEANWDSSRVLNAVWFGKTLPDDLPLIKQQWEAAGVKVNLQQLDDSRIVNVFYETGDYDLCFLYGYGTADGQPWGEDITFGCSMKYPKGFNSTGYCNPEFDRLFAEALATPDQAKQADDFQQLSRLFNDELPYIPYYDQILFPVGSKKLIGPEAMAGNTYNSGLWNFWEWGFAA